MLKKIKKILYRSLENKEISYKKMKEMIKKNTDIVLLDVRSNQEYKEDHLENAINVSLFNLEEQMKKVLKDKSKIIIVYCTTGARSKNAKDILERAGYKEVYNLKNGLYGYDE